MRRSNAAQNVARKKPAIFVGSSLKDLRELPDEVQDVFGRAILQVQWGGMPEHAKPLRGFKGAGVVEIVEDFATDTYRAVYTVRLPMAVYVLHVFQKKSAHGIKTSAKDLDMIESRLKAAEMHHLQLVVRQGEVTDQEKDG